MSQAPFSPSFSSSHKSLYSVLHSNVNRAAWLLHKAESATKVRADGLFPLGCWTVTRSAQRCKVGSVMALRVTGEWYMRVGATNVKVDLYVGGDVRVVHDEYCDE